MDFIPTIVKYVACSSAIIVSAVFGAVQTVRQFITKKKLDKQTAYEDMHDFVVYEIKSAEKAYSGLKFVPNMNSGAFKKEYVLQKLQCYALSKGYEYDESVWEGIIEHEIDFANTVNAPNTEVEVK